MHARVQGEIMGPGKYEHVGESGVSSYYDQSHQLPPATPVHVCMYACMNVRVARRYPRADITPPPSRTEAESLEAARYMHAEQQRMRGLEPAWAQKMWAPRPDPDSGGGGGASKL
jgi:hypothetical protein